eukprot:CAMPEP_0197182344 /NCGR_PEP_ID=MMETSP1423-20130617/6331_1 /TAXON_ID=476441 /ORGANISM="Pseudo-nitzschia heimii, Strain UNC1101" /LENGTH=451 /DNA_ID=CAMNT_0042632753 /DNA_START=32 /DNA_END=1387 /DNA_ORIENTATION=+
MTTEIPLAATEGDPQQQPPKILYCLDFDGVLCDSVHETFLSGWRACKLLWKKKKKKTTTIDGSDADDGNDAEGWIDAMENDPEKMRRLEEDFRYVRPILYVGWEAILLLRLLAAGHDDGDEEGRKVLTGTTLDDEGGEETSSSVRDAVFRGFQTAAGDETGFRDLAIAAWGFAAADYASALSTARTTWIEESESSWIDAHGFYEGACAAVHGCLRSRGNGDVYVITTKAKEFALRLLEKRGLFRSADAEADGAGARTIRESHVFGLGSGPKASVLQRILGERRRNEDDESAQGCVAVMVEDNVATLGKISRSPIGNEVLPVLVSWGYNSIEQLAGVLMAGNDGSDDHPGLPCVVLPLLKESSRVSARENLAEAERSAEIGKRRDPTGCSMASILQTSFDAGTLLLASNSGKGSDAAVTTTEAAVADDDDNNDLYDFVSKRNVALECFGYGS